jgi:hypothetical protein
MKEAMEKKSYRLTPDWIKKIQALATKYKTSDSDVVRLCVKYGITEANRILKEQSK